MKKLLLLSVLVFIGFSSCQNNDKKGWKLVWEENFNQTDSFDSKIWSKIPRGGSDWNRHMSDYDSCYAMRDGKLILRGIVNNTLKNDTAPVITGGVYTKGKKQFQNGRLEINARLHGATGAWPAFWLLPENSKWPDGGEIDIMERLNNDTIAYQTVHSHYTYTLGIDEPKHGGIGAINRDEFNTYTVELYSDSLSFYINNIHTFTYPRIKTDKEGQFPYDRPFYLLLDMQLGGNWVGKVDKNDLPVEMEIDWVRFYQKDN